MDAAFSVDGVQVAVAVSPAAFPRGRQRLIEQQPGQLLLWDWRVGTLLREPLPLPSEPRQLDYSPDGQHLAVICATGELVVIDPATGKTLRPPWPAHHAAPGTGSWIYNGAVRFSPDSRRLLTFVTTDSTYVSTNSARVWD